MTRIRWRVSFMILLFATACGAAQAAPLRYTIDGTASLSLAGATYDDAEFTIVMIGDPAGLVGTELPLSSATFDITGVASTTFLNPTRLGLFSDGNRNIIYFSRNEPFDLGDMFDFSLAGPVDLGQPFGPVNGEGVFGLNQFVNVATSLGALTVFSSSDVQFQATVVPLPLPALLLGSALALTARYGRRDTDAPTRAA